MKVRLGLCVALLCLSQTLAAQSVKTDSIMEMLEEVVITATGTQHLLKDVPVQTEVISGKMLQRYGGRSLEDILGGLTSSFAFNEGDMGSQMQLNGLGNNYILILIDGKRIHGDVGGENDLSLIDPQNIERIEIVKGASSALYGSDAMAGVVNIITKKHDEGILIENTTRYGSYNDLRQHNTIGLASGKWRSLTNFQLQHSDGWQNTATEYTPSSAAPVTDSRSKTVNKHTSWQVAEQLTFTPNKDWEFYASGSIYGKGIYRPKGKYPKYDVKTFDLKYRNASASAGGRWTTRKGDRVTLDVDWNKHAYYHAFTSTTLAEGFDEDGTLILDFPYFEGQKALQSDQQRVMAHLKGVFNLPYEQRLTAGVEMKYDYLKAPTSIEGGSADDNTEALYLQDEWTPSRWLQLTGGLRLNRNEGFGWKLTPKISTMLSLGDFRLRGSWSQGFKTPTLKEMNYRYIREMNSVIMYLGNKDLKAQTSTWGEHWYPGRPVMINKNNYHLQLFNGDIGITMFSPGEENQDRPEMKVLFQMSDGSYRYFSTAELSDYELAYAMTVHKSQGSEFDHTVMVLPCYRSTFITRELLYTGITRAKNFVTIYGNYNGYIREYAAMQSSRSSNLVYRLNI